MEDPSENIWAEVYGHHGAIAITTAALKRGQGHVLYEGPPASGKSAMLDSITGHVPGVVYRDGKKLKANHVTDVFADDPPIFIVDEIDKMHYTVYDAFNLPLEDKRVDLGDGEIRETHTQVIAACNDADKLPKHLRNRFRRVPFEKYPKSEYLYLCEKMLPAKVDWVTTAEEGREIGQLILEHTGSPDPRSARDIARMSTDMKDVRNLIVASKGADADVEQVTLSVNEIARVRGEVEKMSVRSELADEMMNTVLKGVETKESRAIEEEIEAEIAAEGR